MGEMLKYIV